MFRRRSRGCSFGCDGDSRVDELAIRSTIPSTSRCLDQRHATGSAFKGTKVRQITNSRRLLSEPHDLNAARAKRQRRRFLLIRHAQHGQSPPLRRCPRRAVSCQNSARVIRTAVTFLSLSPLYQSLSLAPPKHRFRSSNKIARAKFRKARHEQPRNHQEPRHSVAWRSSGLHANSSAITFAQGAERSKT